MAMLKHSFSNCFPAGFMASTLQEQQASTAASNASDNSAPLPSSNKRNLEHFDIGTQLGEGSYSTVVIATEKETGVRYAIKILNKKQIIQLKKIQYVNLEKNVLLSLIHPFVIKLYYTFQDALSLYFVLELATNGDLHSHVQRLGSFNEDTAQFYSAELYEGLDFLHKNGVLHRDIKPENVLLDHIGHIRITDFGTAKQLAADEDEARSFVGTAEYVSPELLDLKITCRGSDIWAAGCVLYHMLVGKPPFKGPNEYQTFQKVLKAPLEFPSGISEVAKDFMMRVLERDIKKRLGAGGRKAGRSLAKSGESGAQPDPALVEEEGKEEELSEECLTMEYLKQHEFFRGIEWSRLHLRIPPAMVVGIYDKKKSKALLSNPELQSQSSLPEAQIQSSQIHLTPSDPPNQIPPQQGISNPPTLNASSNDSSICKMCLIL